MSAIPTAHTEEACRQAAKDAQLRYVRDSDPGIVRKRHGKGFIYIAPNRERITSEDVLGRIRALAIPPAYRAVWICPLDNGHLQATGRDERQRKQYRYHAKWDEVRNRTKFAQMGEFAEALPNIRKTVQKHLRRDGLPRERVLASIVHLMDNCQMRVGNAQYAAENGTYGLTTLRKKHVEVDGDRVQFEFIGKSGKHWRRDISDRHVAKVVKHCEEIPGYELFKYVDADGSVHDVASEHVNDYLQEISGAPFTAKDFRTWSATAQAIPLIAAIEHAEAERERRQRLNAVIKEIASALGHTPAICRKCYIHPGVLDAYEDGALQHWFAAQDSEADDCALVTAFLARA